MINYSEDRPISYKDQITLLAQSFKGWKSTANLIGINALILVVFGFTFQIIFFGLTLLFWRLVMIFNPAYQLLVRILQRKDLPPYLNKPPTWFVIYSMVWFIFPIVIIIAGMFVLFHVGFCFQNIACLLISISRK
jgi:dolichol kinase